MRTRLDCIPCFVRQARERQNRMALQLLSEMREEIAATAGKEER